MTELVGPAAAAENEAQARNNSNRINYPAIPSYSIAGRSILPTGDYKTRYRQWQIMRDCYAGQLRIKEQGERYLPRPSNVEPKDYDAYKSRSYFYNATRRTHTGLLGAMMRKPPEVTLPTGLKLDLDNVTIDGMSMREFVREISSEMLLISRYGILTDIPKDTALGTAPQPYFSGYCGESIYAIRERLHDGRKIRDRIILIENEQVENEYGYDTQLIIRVLRLDPVDEAKPNGKLRYSQQIIRPASDGKAEQIQNVSIITQGRELDYIPFVLVNPANLLTDSTDPLLLDLAMINLSHYESTALLEHGRFYAGMPTYYIAGQGASNENDPLGDGLGTSQPMSVGPSNVWLLEQGDKCGLLEFTGHGLTFLENAVDSKQLQMHSLGGKLIPTQQKTAALSTEAYGLMESGDEATLLDVAIQIERALTLSLNYANDLQNNPKANNGRMEMNKEFVRTQLTARELRALQTLREGNHIPEDVMYYSLRNVGVIPQEYSLEDFKALMGADAQKYVAEAGPGVHDPDLAEKARLAAIAARNARQAAESEPNPRPSGSGAGA